MTRLFLTMLLVVVTSSSSLADHAVRLADGRRIYIATSIGSGPIRWPQGFDGVVIQYNTGEGPQFQGFLPGVWAVRRIDN